MIKYNTKKDVNLNILHIKTNLAEIKKTYKTYDRILVMGWQNYESVSFLDPEHTYIGIHSHHSWDNKQTTPNHDVVPPKNLIQKLNKFKKVNTVSSRLYNLFYNNGLTNVCYTPNGVDSFLFRPDNNNRDFCVGYSGSANHDWRKGVSEFILPAAKKAKVNTSLAMLSTDKHVPLEEMPTFYGSIDCYICASLSEGFSLSVLEAASCGKPIITTSVGGMTELIDEGKNGFIVDRNVDCIVDKILLLKNDKILCKSMGERIRQKIVNEFCWSKQATKWIDFLTD